MAEQKEMNSATSDAKFTKRQLLKAANFTSVEKDVLHAVLKDDDLYTLDQAKKLVEDYKKKAVK